MATTKIWPVKGRLEKTIRYVINPAKTQDGKLVSGVNLSVGDSGSMAREMQRTKLRFGKTDGRAGYHMEQSFKPGEVTPELAHQIGVEFARRLYGDSFEVVVSTHVDKAHIHNHFVMNSVSFANGHKYHEPNSEYKNRIRRVSDEICEQYGLSTVKNPQKGTYRAYPEAHREDLGKPPDLQDHGRNPPNPTVHTFMYEDIDRAIEFSKDLDEFYLILQGMGYQVRRTGKYPSIAPQGRKFFRLYKFAKGYTEEDISRRISARVQGRSKEPVRYAPEVRLGRRDVGTTYYGSWSSQREYQRSVHRFQVYFLRRYYRNSLYQVYIQYRYLLRSVQRERYPRYPGADLRRELQKLNRYSQQAVILTRNQIHTETDLQEHLEDLEHRAHSLNKEKWYAKRKLSKASPQEKEVLQEKIDQLTAAVKPITREKFLCRDILQRSEAVRSQVEWEKAQAARELTQQRDKGGICK